MTEFDSPQSFPEWFMPWPSFEVNWSSVGLLVVDFQNYGCNPDYGVARMLSEQFPKAASYYLPRLRETIGNTRRLLEVFRRCRREVVFTRHGTLLPDGRDMIARRRQRDAARPRGIVEADGGGVVVGAEGAVLGVLDCAGRSVCALVESACRACVGGAYRTSGSR